VTPIFERFSDYDFQFWVAVQAQDGDVASIHRLFSAFGRDGRNKWFAVREQRQELAGYMADLDTSYALADTAAANDRSASSIGLQARYALITSTLRELAQAHGPELAARYLRTGVWTGEQAMSWARLNPDPQQGVKTSVAMLRLSGVDARPELWAEVLERGGTIPDADNKVQGIADFAGDLPTHLQMRALALIKAEKNEGSRLGGLRKLLKQPHIAPRVQAEALAVAHDFAEAQFRAEALAIVGAALDEPERTQAFDDAIALLERMLGDLWQAKRVGSALARVLPLDLARGLIDDSRFADIREELVRSSLESRVESEPVVVFRELSGAGAWLPDDLLDRLATALSARHSFAEALVCLERISTITMEVKARAIGRFLGICPAELRPQALALLASVRPEEHIAAVRELSSAGAVPDKLLREVAAASTTEYNRNAVRAVIAGILPAPEVESLLRELIADKSWWRNGLLDLAPKLPVELVRTALEHPGGDRSSEAYVALLARLAELGYPHEAIARVARDKSLSSMTRAKVLAALAAHVPDDAMNEIALSVRPRSNLQQRGGAISALLPFLPVSRVSQIVKSMSSCEPVADRLSVLTALMDRLSPSQLPELYPALLDSIRKGITEERRGPDAAVTRAFNVLSYALRRSPSDLVADQAVAAVLGADIERKRQLDLLLGLAATSGEAPHVRLAVRAALTVAADASDYNAYWWLGNWVARTHPEFAGELIDTLADAEAFTAFLEAVAPVLDDAKLETTRDCVELISEPALRLNALRSLLPRLPKESCRCLVARELLLPEWSAEGGLQFVCAVGLFASRAADLTKSHLPAAASIFWALAPRDKVMAVGWLAGTVPVSREYADAAFAAIDDLEAGEQGLAFQLLAPCLNAEQIGIAGHRLSCLEGTDPAPPLEELIARAAHLGEAHLVTDCIEAVENQSTKDRIIQNTVGLLPIETLRFILSSVGYRRGFDKHLSSTVLVELAMRAAVLSDIDLALGFLDVKGNNSSSNDRPIEDIYRFAPASSFTLLRERCRKEWSRGRASLLAALVDIAPEESRASLIAEIVEDASEASNEARVRVIGQIAAELSRFSDGILIGMWTRALRRAAQAFREDVLSVVEAFAPVLIARFGAPVAIELDAAIVAGARENWP
jgi:hypothetical protein